MTMERPRRAARVKAGMMEFTEYESGLKMPVRVAHVSFVLPLRTPGGKWRARLGMVSGHVLVTRESLFYVRRMLGLGVHRAATVEWDD